MANFIAFDLEGPLSPQDNACELMKLFPNGERIFAAISRYDTLLTEGKKEGYEPGDTLALIIPFLVLYGVTEADIAGLSAKATFIAGAENLVHQLQASAWKVFCITSTYEQYAVHLTHRLGIYAHRVACTPFPLDKLRRGTSAEERELLQQTEREILALSPNDDERLKQTLDGFFGQKLPATELGSALKEVKLVSGWRKVAALKIFTDANEQPLVKWVVVGGNTTDALMLHAVETAGGLAVAFNASENTLPFATMSLASTSIGDLLEILQIWTKGQRKAAETVVKMKEITGGKGDRGYFHWLSGRKDIGAIMEIHQRIRQLVQEEAGKLGKNGV